MCLTTVEVQHNTVATKQNAEDIKEHATAAAAANAEKDAEISELRSNATAAAAAIAEHTAEITAIRSMFEELQARFGHLDRNSTALPYSTLEQLKRELRSTTTAIVRVAELHWT